ncbi:MAG: response regulator [Polyangiaceae bacterium]
MQSGLLLLVDADRRVQKAVTRAATDLGLEVVACDTARAGVNAACALEPIAIITELELPDFDGHWFLRQIREQPTDVAVTPIVVVTHEIDTSSRARTLQSGADVFLQKPIAAPDLLAQVRALVDMVERVLSRRALASAAPGPRSAPPPPEAAAEPAKGSPEKRTGPTPLTLAQAIAAELETWSGPRAPLITEPAASPKPALPSPASVPPDIAAALDPAAALAALDAVSPSFDDRAQAEDSWSPPDTSAGPGRRPEHARRSGCTGPHSSPGPGSPDAPPSGPAGGSDMPTVPAPATASAAAPRAPAEPSVALEAVAAALAEATCRPGRAVGADTPGTPGSSPQARSPACACHQVAPAPESLALGSTSRCPRRPPKSPPPARERWRALAVAR